MKNWILAARPKTLPAAVTPVLLGSALAAAQGHFQPLPALLCLSFALLVQVATNFANDYFDARSGADNERRLGPTRAVASGLISAKAMWRATLLVLALALVVGCGLIPFGGWWLVGVGVASLICAVAYTGGPYPLGYHGWGDVFVVLFFGFVAVMMTFYVQAGHFSGLSTILGLGCGLIINNLLVVNNYRDHKTDAEAGKRTVIVRFGRRFGEILLGASNHLARLAALAVVLIAPQGNSLPWLGLGIALITHATLALKISPRMTELKAAQTPADYGHLLQRSALAVVIFGIGYSLALLASGAA